MAEVAQGPDLETIATEAIGFLSIAGEAKLRATSSWVNAPPALHASLLSVASRRGLVAAAGPDAIVIANTQTVRKAFEASPEEGSSMRNLQPELRLPMQMRVSLLAFSADENLLMLSAESGGGLAVYDVESLLQGSTQSAFELGTNGESLRALAPNPTREKAELCAVLTEGGNLHMANLRERSLGAVLRSQVSSISWSTRGKQLVAGLADGTIAQMTPEGEVKAMIPRPPCVQGDHHVSSIVWLENNLFLAIHSSTALDPPEAIYNVITRMSPTSFSYQRLSDPADIYGLSKPVHHSIARLKDWAPDLSDLLLVTSTTSQTLGMLSRAKQPLASEKAPETITNVFTTTEVADDTKRADIPMTETETMDDSITIGTALDLSGKDKVYKPITGHEMEESPGPLPAFWLLTHEGVLCVWWVVYADAVKQGVTYQGMAVVEEQQQQQQQQPPSTSAPPPALAFGAPSSFGAPSTAAPAFGGASALGTRASPWASGAAAAPAFGSSSFGGATPAFGQPSQPAFGQSVGLGPKVSPWASAAAGGSTFGSAAGSGGGAQGVFGAQSAAASGGFASFATKGGFASLGGDSKPGTFGSGASLSTGTESSFSAAPKTDASQGNGFSGFKLESTFKRDPAADKDEPAGSGGGGSLFGSAFGSALGGGGPQIKEEEMGGSAAEPSKPQASLFATPAAKPTAAEQALFTSKAGPVGGGMFGGSVSSTPAAPPPTDGGSLFGGSKPTSTGLFGGPKPASTGLFGGPKPADAASSGVFGKPSTTTTASTGAPFSGTFGQPSGTTGSGLFGQPSGTTGSSVFGQPSGTTGSSVFGRKTEAPPKPVEAPLPPDFTKPTPPAQADEAPLPPDFTAPAPAPEAPLPPDFASKPKKAAAAPAPPTDAALPADEEEDGFSEGSGVDVAKEFGRSSSNVDIAAPAPVASLGRAPPQPSNLFGESGRSRVPTPSQSSAPAAALGQSVQSFASRQDSLRWACPRDCGRQS